MRHCWVQNIRARWLSLRLALTALTVWCVWASAATDPLADLKAGVEAYEGKRYPAAVATLAPLGKRLPQLADYAEWFLASAQLESKDFARVPQTLEPVWKQIPASPLAGRALLLAAKAELQTDSKAALTTLRSNYALLPQPQGDLALAGAYAATGDQVNAAIYDQRVFYAYPLSMEATQAAEDIVHLHATMGTDYPARPGVPCSAGRSS